MMSTCNTPTIHACDTTRMQPGRKGLLAPSDVSIMPFQTFGCSV